MQLSGRNNATLLRLGGCVGGRCGRVGREGRPHTRSVFFFSGVDLVGVGTLGKKYHQGDSQGKKYKELIKSCKCRTTCWRIFNVSVYYRNRQSDIYSYSVFSHQADEGGYRPPESAPFFVSMVNLPYFHFVRYSLRFHSHLP